MEIIQSIVLAIIPSTITGLGLFLVTKRISKSEKKRERHDECREEAQLLLIRSVGASIALGEAAAIALRDGKTNGETKDALDMAKECRKEQEDFFIKVANKSIIC